MECGLVEKMIPMKTSLTVLNRAFRAIAAVCVIGVAGNVFAGNGKWTLTGWNNLGMHCMDDDYSVFSILPPFNTINAQLIDPQGKRVTNPAGITVTYRAVSDPLGSVNRSSIGKTNFWRYAFPLFGVNLALDQGLAGKNMPGPSNIVQPMDWDSRFKMFTATGIPLTPVDDNRMQNTYPMMRIIARGPLGNGLATVDVVLPGSSEMDCRGCHASGSNRAAQPKAGWVRDPNTRRDHRLNILRLHDEKNLANLSYQSALAQNGYLASGPYDTVVINHTPILCAQCHASEALGTNGYIGVSSLTRALHFHHALVIDPKTGLRLNASANRTSCYQCHPGSTTKCLRGAMGSAVAPDGSMQMQCQSCHGRMADVGSGTRTGWLDEPNCQSCHTGTATANNGQIVYTSVFDFGSHMRVPVNRTFATTPNTPEVGKSLYRFSNGHGGMQCEACHGSTHAEFPAATRNDNIYSAELQGHKGSIAECTACHATMPNTVNGGPHGLHPIGQNWVSQHQGVVDSAGAQACQSCHGTDYRGTRLSRAQGNRQLWTEDSGWKTFWRGQTIGCYDCHNGPNGGRNMHPIGQSWVNQHPGIVKNGGSQSCQSCHGADYRGTYRSRAAANRAFTIDDGGTKSFAAGQTIGCYDCHNGPGGGDDGSRTARRAPLVTGSSLVVVKDQPRSVNLMASVNGRLGFRIVSQPEHGTVALQDRVATYFPEAGFTGADSFTFAASDEIVGSNLARIGVRVVGAVDGVPDFTPPMLGTINPPNRAPVSQREFSVNGTASDNRGIALVEYRVGLGPWLAASGTLQWTATIEPSSIDRLTLSFRATDLAGNISRTFQREYFPQ